jgi:pimeloyl-ACP methyl ester carboxylesterase
MPPLPRNAPKPPPETVDPIWLLKAIGLTLVAALICAWLTACLLVYQGSWQLVLHPVQTVDRTPSSVGLAYTDIRFDASETGQPRLTGWWIPASSPNQTQPEFQPKYAAYTVLYLHDGSGSLSNTIPELARLHKTGLSVFAIDYRGFGKSDASEHPSADRMYQDADAALDYLTSTHHLAAGTIIPFGAGLGASIAANLARAHTDIPAAILDNPDPNPAATAVAAHPSHIIPVRLLFGNQFDLSTSLQSLTTPKLLIAGPDPSHLAQIQTLFLHAGSPRFIVTLSSRNADSDYQAVLQRFLDQYLMGR